MSKILKRCCAYFIDMMVVMVIAQSLSGIPVLNPQLEKYNQYYQEYNDMLTEYYNFKSDLTSSYKDSKLTEKEYNKLLESYEGYQELLTKYYEDGKLSKKEYNKILEQIDDDYLEDYQEVYYKVEKYSTVYFAIYLLTMFAYFVGFNLITDGQTLGKKLFRLKIVSAKEGEEKVSVWSYLIRAVILYQPIYYIVKLIGIYILSGDLYYNVTSIVYDIQYYLEFIIILTVMIRMDGRGIQDLLAKTRVCIYDKMGREIEEQANNFLTKKLDENIKIKKKAKQKVQNKEEK